MPRQPNVYIPTCIHAYVRTCIYTYIYRSWSLQGSLRHMPRQPLSMPGRLRGRWPRQLFPMRYESMRVCMCMRTFMCMRKSGQREALHVGECDFVCMCERGFCTNMNATRACMHAYIRTYIHTYIQDLREAQASNLIAARCREACTCIHTYTHTHTYYICIMDLHTCTYTHTHIHTYTHTGSS
jgi:hypothetical protein